jgi:hypothetical protein
MIGSKLAKDVNSRQHIIEQIQRIRHYASQGCLVILKDLDYIYSTLYPLFDQQFLGNQNQEFTRTCFITYYNFREPVMTHPDFRILLVKSENDLISNTWNIERKLPSHLINRFQKHIVSLHGISKKSRFLSWSNL